MMMRDGGRATDVAKLCRSRSYAILYAMFDDDVVTFERGQMKADCSHSRWNEINMVIMM